MSLAFPHRENFLAKEECLVVSGTARPGSRRGPPLVSRFLPTRELSINHHNSASHHECKNTRHRDAAATCTYRRTLATILGKFAIGSYLM